MSHRTPRPPGIRKKRSPTGVREVLVDDPDGGPAGTAQPVTVEQLRLKQNELLEQMPTETRRRLKYLAKHWDIPELAALRMAISDAYQDALDDGDD